MTKGDQHWKYYTLAWSPVVFPFWVLNDNAGGMSLPSKCVCACLALSVDIIRQRCGGMIGMCPAGLIMVLVSVVCMLLLICPHRTPDEDWLATAPLFMALSLLPSFLAAFSVYGVSKSVYLSPSKNERACITYAWYIRTRPACARTHNIEGARKRRRYKNLCRAGREAFLSLMLCMWRVCRILSPYIWFFCTAILKEQQASNHWICRHDGAPFSDMPGSLPAQIQKERWGFVALAR